MERLTSRIDLRKLSARRTVWYAMHVPGSARHDGIPHAMMCCVDFRGLCRFRHDASRRCIFRVRGSFSFVFPPEISNGSVALLAAEHYGTGKVICITFVRSFFFACVWLGNLYLRR